MDLFMMQYFSEEVISTTLIQGLLMTLIILSGQKLFRLFKFIKGYLNQDLCCATRMSERFWFSPELLLPAPPVLLHGDWKDDREAVGSNHKMNAGKQSEFTTGFIPPQCVDHCGALTSDHVFSVDSTQWLPICIPHCSHPPSWIHTHYTLPPLRFPRCEDKLYWQPWETTLETFHNPQQEPDR